MKCLTRDILARDVRQIIKEAYGTVENYCNQFRRDERDTRRTYSEHPRVRARSGVRPRSIRALERILDDLGYELHTYYEIRIKGESNDADRILHADNPTESSTLHNGSER